MAVKLIALDMDGTTLNTEKRISAVTKAALERCFQKGIYIVPATGRMSGGIPSDIKSIKGIRYTISANGAVIEDMTEKRILARNGILWSEAIKILDIIKRYPVLYDAQIEGSGKCETRFLQNLEKYVQNPEIRKIIIETRTGVLDLLTYIEEAHRDVDKFNITFTDLAIRDTVKKELLALNNIQITSSYADNLEINSLNATKGKGLAFLTSYLGLSRNETMACGDAENDSSMLRQAGIGIAMGNASEQIKRLADFVTASNDEDGVALAIERFCVI